MFGRGDCGIKRQSRRIGTVLKAVLKAVLKMGPKKLAIASGVKYNDI
jgi:hypothetical protein